MRFASLATAAALTIALASAASAQSFPGAPGGVLVLDGKCSKLVVAKLDASKSCKGELASVTMPNGMVTFIFSAGGKMLGFEGDGRAIAPASGGSVRFPVHMVSSAVGSKITGQVEAAGFCTFGNPFAGQPTAVECSAKNKDANFTGSFRTSGKPPHKK